MPTPSSPTMSHSRKPAEPSATTATTTTTTIDEGRVVLNAASSTAPVHFRRTKGRTSLTRLSDIMSAYIPMRAPVGVDAPDMRPLLEADEDGGGGGGVGEASDVATAVAQGGYRVVKLLHLPSLFADSSWTELAERDVTGVAIAESGFIFVSFDRCARILRLRQPQQQQEQQQEQQEQQDGSDELEEQQQQQQPDTFNVFEVTVRRLALVPKHICVRGQQLFVSGCVDRDANRMAVVARCDLDGNVLQVSKELPEPKFFSFDVDPVDRQLVVASPSPATVKESQIFKMSDDFKRKVFKIELGRGERQFRPEFVACQSERCWVSTRVGDDFDHRRLLSFPLRPPPPPRASAIVCDDVEKQTPSSASTKSWLRVSSWKFEQLQPGRLLALPATDGQPERLLVLDEQRGNVFCLNDDGCTPLTHPESGGGFAFVDFCRLPYQSGVTRAPGAVEILAASRDSLYLVLVA